MKRRVNFAITKELYLYTINIRVVKGSYINIQRAKSKAPVTGPYPKHTDLFRWKPFVAISSNYTYVQRA